MKRLARYFLFIGTLFVLSFFHTSVVHANAYCFDCGVGYQTCDGAYPGGAIVPDASFEDGTTTTGSATLQEDGLLIKNTQKTESDSPVTIINIYILKAVKFLSFGTIDFSK